MNKLELKDKVKTLRKKLDERLEAEIDELYKEEDREYQDGKINAYQEVKNIFDELFSDLQLEAELQEGLDYISESYVGLPLIDENIKKLENDLNALLKEYIKDGVLDERISISVITSNDTLGIKILWNGEPVEVTTSTALRGGASTAEVLVSVSKHKKREVIV